MNRPSSPDQAFLDDLLAKIPYAAFLGVRFETAGDEMTAILPFSPPLIGNPLLPALHGGVTGALMELTAMAQLALVERRSRVPKPIDVNVEYLRSGKPLTTFARAHVAKAGKRVANVRVEAWQETRSSPIAAYHAHFLLGESGPEQGSTDG